MLEKEFATRWQYWWSKHKNVLPDNFIFEHKVTNGNTFNLKTWRNKQSHQLRSLQNAICNVGVCFKISDQSVEQKPCDGFVARNSHSFLIIHFNKHKVFFHIPTKDIPDTVSISFDYCLSKYTSYLLLPVKKVKRLVDF